MTLCNMTIEAGARAGMVAPDDTTFDYLAGREFAPGGADWDEAVEQWRALATDEGAVFDRSITLDVSSTRAHDHVGHQSGDGDPGHRPGPGARRRQRMRVSGEAEDKALSYMGIEPGKPIAEQEHRCGFCRILHQLAHFRPA